MQPAALTALVVAIGFAAGLNVYVTALALGVMTRLHWAVLPGTLGEIANPWVMGACAVLFAAEFVADKIPGFDVLSNLAHTFVRIPLAALMAYAASANLPLEMHLIATAAGATFATAAHSSKTVARLVVTPSPEPVSNITLSSLEDVLALGLTGCAVHQPVVDRRRGGGADAGRDCGDLDGRESGAARMGKTYSCFGTRCETRLIGRRRTQGPKTLLTGERSAYLCGVGDFLTLLCATVVGCWASVLSMAV